MAASNAVFHFVAAGGSVRGMTMDVSAYLDDTANNLIRFDQAAKAGTASPDSWTAPVDMALTDMVIAAATGQTTTQLQRNGIPTGDYLLNALHLASVVTRPHLGVIIPRGTKFQAKQIA